MDSWKVKEFKEICRNLGLSDACLYADSLAIIWEYAKYRRSIIQENLNEMKDPKSFFNNMAWHSFIINCELNSLMLSLNSIFDILGQLINKCFIIPDIPVECVTFDKLVNNNLIPKDIKTTLESIKRNSLYQVIRAYANISKHRHIIQGSININLTEAQPSVSYNTTEFEYKKKWHKLTHEKAFECFKFIGESLIQVGNSTQELLQAQVTN